MAVEKLRFEFDGDASKFQSAVNKSQKSVNNFSTSLKQVGGIIAGAFAIDKLMEFGGAVVETTSTFQRFESVLTNTLGSQSEAQKALDRITEFASQTPFSVAELTDSFVRLANQGFRPTSEEMRKLGDLASSTGKDFVQLTEAVIDAQVGEFERLKEFGIRASKQGDQVKFTFKGVETQVKFTADAINDYVLSLGDLEGVSGAMVGISKTLGAQISNLGDSFDSLKNEIGEALMPILTSAIGAFKNLFENITRVLNPQKALLNDFKATKKELDDMNSSTDKLAGNELRVFNIRKQLLEQKYNELEKEINLELEKGKNAIIEEQKEFAKLVEVRNRAEAVVETAIKNKVKENDGLATYKKILNEATLEVENQKNAIEQVTLSYESFKLSLENILNPVEEVKEVFKQTSSNYQGFTLNTHKAKEATNDLAGSLSIANLEEREMLETTKVTQSAFGELADSMRQIGMSVGMAFAQMAMQGQKSIQQIINSLAKMIVQMGIALIVGTALKSLLDPKATAVTARNLAMVGAIVAGAGILGTLTRPTGEVQGFANGGIITKPTMGIIGERGQSEAIIPLNRLPQLMGTMGSNQRGEFTLRGQDLILALERAGDFRTRVTG